MGMAFTACDRSVYSACVHIHSQQSKTQSIAMQLLLVKQDREHHMMHACYTRTCQRKLTCCQADAGA